MNFSASIFLIVIAFLFLFAEQTKAQGPVIDVAETGNLLVSEVSQNSQEEIITPSSNKESLQAHNVIEAIKSQAQKFNVDGVFSLAFERVTNSINFGVRFVASNGRNANKAIDTASKLIRTQDYYGAIDAIKKGFQFNKDLDFSTGVAKYDALGYALVIVGGEARQGLRNAIISLQNAANLSFEILDIAREFAISGLITGDLIVAVESLKAARDVISTGTTSIDFYLSETARNAMEGLQNAALEKHNQTNLVPGIIRSLTTETSTDNPSALAAILRINTILKSVLPELTKEPTIDAANVMAQGLISTIIEITKAFEIANKTIEDEGKLSSQNTEATVSAMRMGFNAARAKILSGSDYGYLGLPAAGNIAGNPEIGTPTNLKFQSAKISAYDGLDLAEKIIIIGLQAGGKSVDLGRNAAIQICNAAASKFYSLLAITAEIGFEELKKMI